MTLFTFLTGAILFLLICSILAIIASLCVIVVVKVVSRICWFFNINVCDD